MIHSNDSCNTATSITGSSSRKEGLVRCRLQHHGAAAAVSGNQIVAWVRTHDDDDSQHTTGSATSTPPSSSTNKNNNTLLVYASHANLNLVDPNATVFLRNTNNVPLHQPPQPQTALHVTQTLRCTAWETAVPSTTIATEPPPVITCLCAVAAIPLPRPENRRRRTIHTDDTHATSPTKTSANNTIAAIIVSGFSNGSIQIWLRCTTTTTKENSYQDKNGPSSSDVWTEHSLPHRNDETGMASDPQALAKTTAAAENRPSLPPVLRSIATLDATVISSASDAELSDTATQPLDSAFLVLLIVAGTSAGATLYHCPLIQNDDGRVDVQLRSQQNLVGGAISSVHFASNKSTPTPPTGTAATTTTTIQEPKTDDPIVPKTPLLSSLLLFVGTAAPRHNKIHIYSLLPSVSSSTTLTTPLAQCAGTLTGHEDWITSLSFAASMLASASQDARIRLWKFRTVSAAAAAPAAIEQGDQSGPNETLSLTPPPPTTDTVSSDNDSLLDDEDDKEDMEGESRLEILHDSGKWVTTVTLEALLYGHEESVTSVAWHPDPTAVYGVDRILISSSMDRTIFFWSESQADGIWTPISRVGSAGGILGGSMGSTLLGFCSVVVEPVHGRTLVGHAYGGALHTWESSPSQSDAVDQTRDHTKLALWSATPCLTGHFDGVTDLSWEASSGEYLLTVSGDQTCRLWAPVASDSGDIWLELARPQVHGYDLTAVVSLSTKHHPHTMVTGADEKELRVFDAPKTTLRMLKAATGYESMDASNEDRVERAFIPSLGLSNKASAADAAAEDDVNDRAKSNLDPSTIDQMSLPLERDLGSVSLWPEVQKLFGHNTEIIALASTVGSRTAFPPIVSDWTDDVLVASSAKAREVEDAKIRLWDVRAGKCVQVLSGGHKSTVTALCFSPDGRYLASSGKDRRLCIWKRQSSSDTPLFALTDAKDLAHKRIVWSVDFCPLDSSILASGSRDGCVKIWRLDEVDNNGTEDGRVHLTNLVSFEPSFQRHGKPDAVTSLSFAPVILEEGWLVLAIGLESGRIELWTIPSHRSDETNPVVVPRLANSDLDATQCHSAKVCKIAWRPMKTANSSVLHMASCSMDHGCRIWEISISSDESSSGE